MTVALKTGDKAPAFELLDQQGQTLTLDDFKGDRLLIYFYPKANTPGCTIQSCAVSQAQADFAAAGIRTIGISPDKPAAQKKFDDKYDLGFPLLCDTEHSVAEAYGVWTEKSMYGKKYMGILRSSFLIDAEGVIEEAWYKVSPKDTVPNALDV
ncbi:MAG: thioredoxin-dependent thiol peroxidase [Verrucomicrobia bacterium]|jgi:thioredoxin-dependent peroxiredoxin|nr:thioredoxin-dependent thiol peroxidase [Verrucomicrobiota bacterium]MBT7064958.1 thioredoxin-dependent thiol peroxidase [Verrucomicrobiota bacterium]MBT7702065.1 thioredoxin-dependent thiol peroxidase [Verrucomicrobiota bacterium]